jgi:hypothetical protein
MATMRNDQADKYETSKDNLRETIVLEVAALLINAGVIYFFIKALTQL